MHKTITTYKLKNILILILLLSGLKTNAQEVHVDARLDTSSILIGDQVDFKIRLQIPTSTSFLWPALADTLPENIEIVKRSDIDTTRLDDGFLNVEQILTLTVFDSGYYVIKPLEFRYGDNLSESVETEPYLLNVFTVEVDTTQAMKPIKGPMSAPLTFAEILPWGLAGLFFIALIIGLIYYLSKKKNKQPIIIKKPKPKIPAHRLALDELEKLKYEKLWQRDKIKEYHSRLTDILRVYIEDVFNIPAPEMTTWEIIRSFAGAKIEKSNLESLRIILELADLVKFAKYKPLPDEHEKSMTLALRFVQQTMLFDNNTANHNNTEENKMKPEVAVG
jgi:hypothetical protein